MPKYYSIDEDAARRAKEANSFSDYVAGSATAAYKRQVDQAIEVAEKQKRRVDPSYHDRIDALLDSYSRRLAENINHANSIDASCPSVLVAGPANFPVRKKEKQNARRDANMAEWQKIQGILDTIRSTGMGGIMSDDPDAIAKLKKKLADREAVQERMKAINAYYRKYKTLDGCPVLTSEQITRYKATGFTGFAAWELTNNNANIRRIRERIATLEKEVDRAAASAGEVAGEGYTLTENTAIGRIQFRFDEKPCEEIRNILKANGFRWAPSEGAWQRMLNDNGRYAANTVIAKMSTLEV